PEIEGRIVTRDATWVGSLSSRLAIAVPERIADVVNSVSATSPSDRQHATVGGPISRRGSRLEGEVGSVPLFTRIDHVVKITISRQLTIEILAGETVSCGTRISVGSRIEVICDAVARINPIICLITFTRCRQGGDFGFGAGAGT